LQKLGIDILAAHLLVFYYAVLADVTPPVAVTAFAGAQIAGADPMKTGWQGCRFAIGGFLAPFLFVYQPALLLNGTLTEIVIALVSAIVGISALSAAVAGHMFRPLSWPQRGLLVAVSLAAISSNLMISAATSAVLLAFAAWDARRARLATAPAAPTPAENPGQVSS
jgi:TRAP-type uncharacterized transport system fused permease subunit